MSAADSTRISLVTSAARNIEKKNVNFVEWFIY
jgi:hypothetical protein